MEQNHDQITTGTICDQIGRKIVADRMGVGKTAVGNAVADGVFPARWYREMRALCDEREIPCPDELFNFVWSGEIHQSASDPAPEREAS